MRGGSVRLIRWSALSPRIRSASSPWPWGVSRIGAASTGNQVGPSGGPGPQTRGEVGIEEGLELAPMIVGRHQANKQGVASGGGVDVDLAGSGRQVVEEAAEAGGGHVAAPGDAEAVVGGEHAGACDLVSEPSGPGAQRGRAEGRARAAGREWGGGFGGNADRAQSVVAADVDEHASDGGMKVHVLVGVGMVERQAGRGEGLELGADFRGEFASCFGIEEVAHSALDLIGTEFLVVFDKMRDTGVRQDGRSFNDDEVQPDAEVRQSACASNGVVGGVACNHEAGGREDAIRVCAFDALVDGFRKPEIIR